MCLRHGTAEVTPQVIFTVVSDGATANDKVRGAANVGKPKKGKPAEKGKPASVASATVAPKAQDAGRHPAPWTETMPAAAVPAAR